MPPTTLTDLDLDRALQGLPSRIKEARQHHGWNQAKLGKEAHVTQQGVNKLESKPTKNPSITSVFKIARATGFSFAYLAFGIEPKIDAGVSALTRLRERDVESAIVASVNDAAAAGIKISSADRHRIIAVVLSAIDSAGR